VWADTFLRAEQVHLLRLLAWGALSIIAGTGVAATIAVRRSRSPLLAHFALQIAVWGFVVAVIAAVEWRALHLPDLAAAARAERVLWMNIGFDAGFVGMGAVLAVCARALTRNAAALGAGIGIVVQGLALLVIDLQFAAAVSR
jgi:hypothetical protein